MSRNGRQEDSNILKQILATASKDTNKIDLKSISIDELWALHEQIASILSANMRAKKARIEKLIDKLEGRALNRSGPYRRYRIVPEVSKRGAAASDLVRSRQAATLDA